MRISKHLATASFVLGLTATTAVLALPPVVSTLTLPSPFASAPTPVLSWSLGATSPSTIGSGSGGAGAGKVTFQDLALTRNTDSQSPLIFEAMVTGSHLTQVVLTTGSVSMTFKPVFITGYKSAFVEGEKPIDTVTLSYGAISSFSVSGICVGAC